MIEISANSKFKKLKSLIFTAKKLATFNIKFIDGAIRNARGLNIIKIYESIIAKLYNGNRKTFDMKPKTENSLNKYILTGNNIIFTERVSAKLLPK